MVALLTVAASGQGKARVPKFPAGVPVKETGVEATGGKVEDRTYINTKFDFEITVPDSWFIAGPDFEKVLKDSGHDLRIDAIAAKTNREIDLLMTAFRSETGREGAVLRITAENLRTHPQIVDAVDYFDAITAAYASTKLPPDFSYSRTKAEQLGAHQFAYLDTSSNAGRKRLYATVIKRFAIMFTLSYSSDDDLRALRDILSTGRFPKK